MEGEFVEFTAQLDKPGIQVKWFKGDKPLKPDKNHEVTSDGTTYKLRIPKSELDDTADYTIKLPDGKDSKANLQVDGKDGNINSLAPGKFEWNFRYVTFKRILVTDGWGISFEIALIWMSLDFIDDQSTLVQVSRQAISHYLSQCWPRSLSPHGVTRPQWVNENRINWNKIYQLEDFLLSQLCRDWQHGRSLWWILGFDQIWFLWNQGK